MNATASLHRARVGRLRGLAIGAAAAGLLASCSVAASPSPTTGASPSPSGSATTQVAATPTPTLSSAPTPTATPFPSVEAAPAGPWSGIRWISAGPVFPQTPVPVTDGGSVQVSVFGWSRGYVGFRTAVDQSNPSVAATMSIVSTFSADGLHWTAGRPLDIEGLMKTTVGITAVIEGPSGLLAVGRYQQAACGGPATVDVLWTSSDGLTWTRVTPPADFASASVYTIDGGSTGYIASGTLKDGVTQAVWLSADGRSWRQSPLPKATFGTVVVDGATAFSAGYVVAGAVLGDEGCGGARLLTPSLWWSANGASWTRSKLTGATPASDATMTVSRISDRALVAIATEWNSTTQLSSQLVWATSDGQTWKLVKSPSSLLSASVLSNGQRGLVVIAPPDNNGPPTIATVSDDLTVTALSQSGNGPIASASSTGWVPAALGPTGVVILSSDGLNLWLGVPTAP